MDGVGYFVSRAPSARRLSFLSASVALVACGGASDYASGPGAPIPMDVAAPGVAPGAGAPPGSVGTGVPGLGTGSAGSEAPPPANTEPSPPVAVLIATPDTGAVPLMVTLDATGSHDAQDPPEALEARFDLDGDGAWDTDFTAARTAQVTYEALGSYAALVEVRDTDAMTDVADAPATVTVGVSATPFADIAVDANRDGVVDPLDDMHEATWSVDFGAAFLANLDDDDGNGARDGNDEKVDGPGDMDDLLPIFVRKVSALGPSQEVRLTVGPAAGSSAVRLFFASGELLKGTGSTTATIPSARVGEGDIELRIESSTGRTASWDGEITLDLEVRDGTKVLSSDHAVMRVAPVIMPDDTQAMETLYLMRIADAGSSPNLPFYDAVVANLPKGIDLFTVSETDYGADRWVQDSMQTGYQTVPVADGVRRVDTYLQTERSTPQQGLESLLPYGLLGADLGYAYPGGSATSHNYGGNLEVVPPHDGHPLGRLLVGGGAAGTLLGSPSSDHMASAQQEWLEAQGVQGPALELSTEWLSVGHLDEIFQAISAPASERGWKFAVASPDLAIKALEDLDAKGQGSTKVFAGHEAETTVSGILNNSELMRFNAKAQARIDSIRMILTDEIGLKDDDFVELPVLYEPHWDSGTDMAAAYNPGMQNLVSANDVLFVPDPAGPPVWQDMTRAALEATGHKVVFVDVYSSYHVLLGEAHCGSNFRRVPYDARWWEVGP